MQMQVPAASPSVAQSVPWERAALLLSLIIDNAVDFREPVLLHGRTKRTRASGRVARTIALSVVANFSRN
jgi:hypothetical protein